MLIIELFHEILLTIIDNRYSTGLTWSIVFTISHVLLRKLFEKYKSVPIPKIDYKLLRPRITFPRVELSPLSAKRVSITAALALSFSAVCCLATGYLFLLPTSAVDATVSNVHWQTFVPVQEVQSVDYSNERGSAPSDAYNVSCYDESRDVCEQKTIDQGNGYSEIIEECHTETEKYCSYTVDEWKTIQTYTLEGNDLRPIYESPNISSDQRLGDQSEEFTVTFSAADRTEVYSPDTLSTFQQFEIGSTWTLELNLMGGVVGVER